MSEEEEQTPEKYPQWALHTTHEPGVEYVLSWHKPIWIGCDSDGDYVFYDETMDPTQEEYIDLSELCGNWGYYSYIGKHRLLSLRQVSKDYDPSNDEIR